MAARSWMDPKVASSNPGRAGTFLHFFKNLRNFYKNHISRGKNHEEHESGVKKIPTPRKTLWNQIFSFSKGFSWSRNFLTPDSCSSWFFTPRNVVFIKISTIFEKMQKKFRPGRDSNLRPLDSPKIELPSYPLGLAYQTFFELLRETNYIRWFFKKNLDHPPPFWKSSQLQRSNPKNGQNFWKNLI